MPLGCLHLILLYLYQSNKNNGKRTYTSEINLKIFIIYEHKKEFLYKTKMIDELKINVHNKYYDYFSSMILDNHLKLVKIKKYKRIRLFILR